MHSCTALLLNKSLIRSIEKIKAYKTKYKHFKETQTQNYSVKIGALSLIYKKKEKDKYLIMIIVTKMVNNERIDQTKELTIL